MSMSTVSRAAVAWKTWLGLKNGWGVFTSVIDESSNVFPGRYADITASEIPFLLTPADPTTSDGQAVDSHARAIA
jgi:hypothetical protein